MQIQVYLCFHCHKSHYYTHCEFVESDDSQSETNAFTGDEATLELGKGPETANSEPEEEEDDEEDNSDDEKVVQVEKPEKIIQDLKERYIKLLHELA